MHCKNPYAIQRLAGQTLKSIPTSKYEFFVPCGKCLYCRLQRRKEWCLRLTHENQAYTKSAFITLTYDDENLPLDKRGEATLKKTDLQQYWKDLRKKGHKFKYYACGEYGEPSEIKPNGYRSVGNRPHYHALVFGMDAEDKIKITTKSERKFNVYKSILKQNWTHGDVHLGYVTPDSIRYTAQYIDKKIYGKKADNHYRARTPEFQCQSQGLGYQFLIDNLRDITSNGYITFKGTKCGIPRYYLKKMQEKLLTSEEWETFSRAREKTAKFKQLDINLAILKTDTKEYHQLSMAEKDLVKDSLIKQGKQVEQTLKDKARIYNQTRRKL